MQKACSINNMLLLLLPHDRSLNVIIFVQTSRKSNSPPASLPRPVTPTPLPVPARSVPVRRLRDLGRDLQVPVVVIRRQHLLLTRRTSSSNGEVRALAVCVPAPSAPTLTLHNGRDLDRTDGCDFRCVPSCAVAATATAVAVAVAFALVASGRVGAAAGGAGGGGGVGLLLEVGELGGKREGGAVEVEVGEGGFVGVEAGEVGLVLFVQAVLAHRGDGGEDEAHGCVGGFWFGWLVCRLVGGW